MKKGERQVPSAKPISIRRPCPPSSTHRRETPLGTDERRACRALHREGKTVAWIASHYGATMREISAVLRPPKQKSKSPSPPSEPEAVTA